MGCISKVIFVVILTLSNGFLILVFYFCEASREISYTWPTHFTSGTMAPILLATTVSCVLMGGVPIPCEFP